MEPPAKKLLGVKTDDGWVVVEQVTLGPMATGGAFSSGYIVERNGERAFMKALDYSSALGPGVDTPAELQRLTAAFLFERGLLERCGEKRMDRVVKALGQGSVVVNEGMGGKVDYLLFELAEGDVRKHMGDGRGVGEAWILRALHQVSVGLEQLHREAIAHQDLKPSNVLVFGASSSKVGDLGRAAAKGVPGPHDDRRVAGDWGYAPPEALYGQNPEDWAARRMGCDMYHLGSLIVFMFSSVSMTALMITELPAELHFVNYRGFYNDALPHLRDAIDRGVRRFSETVPEWCREELVLMVRQLCDPDPARRGHPKNLVNRASQYSLERYISSLNLLAKRAESMSRKSA